MEHSRARTERIVRVAEWLAVAPRCLFGLLFLATGSLWFLRTDSVGYLTEALSAPRLEDPTGLYDQFLAGVVLVHPGHFVFLVGAGELASGIALIFGHPSRAGAAGALFLTVNYGLAFRNTVVPPTGNFLLALALLPMLTSWPYRHLAWRRGRR